MTIRTITDAAKSEWRAQRALHEWGGHRALHEWCAVCQIGIERFCLEHSVGEHHPDDRSAPLQLGCPPCDVWRAEHPASRRLGPPAAADEGPVTIQPADQAPGYAISTETCEECGREMVACIECPDLYDGSPCERCSTCDTCKKAHIAVCVRGHAHPVANDRSTDRRAGR